MLYNLICIAMIGSGAGILYKFDYMEHSGKAVLAIALIVFGLFLLLFKGKSADEVSRGLKGANDTLWWWPW